MAAEDGRSHDLAGGGATSAGSRDLPFSSRVLEVTLLFSRFGFTAFGGPAAHVAMMEQEVVVRRRWLDRRQFLDAYAAINFIPGPGSTELAIYLGWMRAGIVGLLTAGFCFITPAVLIILPIAWGYTRYGQAPQVRALLVGINAVVAAVVTAACVRFGRTALRSRFDIAVAVAALAAVGLVALLTARHAQADLTVLAAAAAAGVARKSLARGASPAGLPLLAAPLAIGSTTSAASLAPGGLLQLAWVFLKIGATLFGSGYVLVSYLQSSVVDHFHWLTPDQLGSAISVGQFTPGPLLTTATFIGYLRGEQIFHSVGGGVLGAVVATAAIFAPAFVLIAIGGRYLKLLRESVWAAAALDAVNAAVVALIAIASIRLLSAALAVPAPYGIAVILPLYALSLLALLRWNVNATWLIVIGGAVGAAAAAIRG